MTNHVFSEHWYIAIIYHPEHILAKAHAKCGGRCATLPLRKEGLDFAKPKLPDFLLDDEQYLGDRIAPLLIGSVPSVDMLFNDEESFLAFKAVDGLSVPSSASYPQVAGFAANGKHIKHDRSFTSILEAGTDSSDGTDDEVATTDHLDNTNEELVGRADDKKDRLASISSNSH